MKLTSDNLRSESTVIRHLAFAAIHAHLRHYTIGEEATRLKKIASNVDIIHSRIAMAFDKSRNIKLYQMPNLTLKWSESTKLDNGRCI